MGCIVIPVRDGNRRFRISESVRASLSICPPYRTGFAVGKDGARSGDRQSCSFSATAGVDAFRSRTGISGVDAADRREPADLRIGEALRAASTVGISTPIDGVDSAGLVRRPDRGVRRTRSRVFGRRADDMTTDVRVMTRRGLTPDGGRR